MRPLEQLVSRLVQRILFRPSRPDFIETVAATVLLTRKVDCSGHLGRTSLRRLSRGFEVFLDLLLFRPSRPDFIETVRTGVRARVPQIVPAI